MKQTDAVVLECVVLIADNKPDNSGDRFDPAGLDMIDGQVVRVNDGYRQNVTLGTAVLYREGRKLLAKMTLYPRKWGLSKDQFEKVAGHLYPAISGSILKRSKRASSKIIEYTVKGIVLSVSPNMDKRIKPLELK